MNSSTIHRFLIVALAVASVLAACADPRPVDDIRMVADGDRPECPHNWEDVFGSNAANKRPAPEGPFITIVARPGRVFPAVAATSVNTYMISGDITNIPEFHDCQRLISVDGTTRKRTFAELAAIFASDRTDSVVAAEGPFVAAEVYSEGRFPSLGIRAGFHCLVADVTSKSAVMLYLGASHVGLSCRDLNPDALPSSLLAHPLALEPDPPTKLVPAVTRWEFDSTSGQQLIGIKCAPTQWCTIGPIGPIGPTGPAGFVAPLPNPGASPVMQSPGWFDDQYIADYPTSGITPGNAFGRAFPAENLGQYTALSQFNDWKLVAHVEMPAGFPATYQSKLGFGATAIATTTLTGLNQVFFCYGTDATCNVPLGDLGVKNGGCTDASWNGPSMWAKVVSATGTPPRYHCVAFRPHGTITSATFAHARFDIPGVVRWRWRADDETLWVRCPTGCCEVHAGL